MRLFIALLCAMLAMRAVAQEAQLGVPTRIEDPTGRLHRRLRAALTRLRRGEARHVRLSFWGASHTASDQFTGFLRERLVHRYGDGGPGFFLPAAPFVFFDRRDLAFRSAAGFSGRMIQGANRALDRYGVAGIALDASGEASATVRPRARDARIAHVELHYLAQPLGGHVSLGVGGEVVSASTAAASPSLGTIALDVAPGQHAIEVRALGDGPTRVLGVLAESDRPGVIVESFGVPGARARDQALWDPALFEAHLARVRPDLFAIAYGTNESGGGGTPREVEENVRAALSRYRAALPEAACLVIGPSDRPRRTAQGFEPRARSAEIRDAFRRAALAEECGFFDLLALQGGPGSVSRWVEAGLACDDHVHLTDEGHARVAELLEEALLAR